MHANITLRSSSNLRFLKCYTYRIAEYSFEALVKEIYFSKNRNYVDICFNFSLSVT